MFMCIFNILTHTPKMKADNYYLKEIQSTDIENIYKGLSDPDVTKFYDVHFDTLEATKEQMDWYHNLKANGTGIWWGIYGSEDKQFRGAAGFNNLEKNHKKAEIGLWLLKEYWGHGILKEVMSIVFEKGFNELNLNRIEGYVLNDNDKCKKALDKINFTFEGTMRECEMKNGEFLDIDLYAILKKDWHQK